MTIENVSDLIEVVALGFEFALELADFSVKFDIQSFWWIDRFRSSVEQILVNFAAAASRSISSNTDGATRMANRLVLTLALGIGDSIGK